MRRWYPILLIAVASIGSLIAFPRLPTEVPIHWDVRGNVNGYSSRAFAALFVPALILVLWLVLRGLPKIDPWRANYAKMAGAYDLMVNAVLSLLALIHLAVLGLAVGLPIPLGRIVILGVCAIFIALGRVLPDAKPNFWFGIRTPWTLTNPRVWERTHRVAGYLMVVAGVLGIGAAFLRFEFAVLALAFLGITASVIPLVYSYFAWKQETSR